MTTFVLKKYADAKPTVDEQSGEETEAVVRSEKEVDKKLTVAVDGSIAKIVADALYKAFPQNSGVDIEETEEEEETEFKAVSTESINKEPLNTLRSIKASDIVLVSGKGFTTSTEDWFLLNLFNKTDKVFYTAEAYVEHLKSVLLAN